MRRLLGELERDRDVIRIMLERLLHEQVRDLALELRGAPLPEAELEGLMSRSEGVPFFVEELVAFGDDDPQIVPETLRELLLARYERLHDPAQVACQSIGSRGHGGRARAWSAACRTGDDLDERAREALLGGVIQADHDAYRFRHALVREAILDDVLPGEHERIHARYAAEYERLADDKRPLSAAIAHHWIQARDQVRAFPATLRAAREARAALAFGSAAQHGERALALWHAVPDADARGRDVEARAVRAHDDPICATRESSSEALPWSLPRSRNASLARSTKRSCCTTGRRRSRSWRARRPSIVFCESLAAAERLDDGSDPRLAALHSSVMVSFSGWLMLAGAVSEARELALSGAALARSHGDERTASVGVNVAAVCLVATGDAVGALRELEDAKRIAADDGPAQVRYFVNASDAAHLLGQYQHAVSLAQQGVDAARRLGFERTSGVLLSSNLAEPLVWLGEWSRADAIITRALSLEPPRSYRTHLLVTKAAMLTWRGNAEAADALLREQRTVLVASMAAEVQSLMGVGRAATETALAMGDVQAAWEHAAGLLDTDPARLCAGRVHACAWPAARTIAAARASGSPRAAADAEPRLRALVARFSEWPIHDVWAPVIDAELTNTTDAWRGALTAARDERAPVHLEPYVLVRLGESLITGGERSAARDTLTEAIDAAERGGVTAMRERALELAADAGLSSARPPRRGSGALTEREQQVLALVAEGLSNGQIGQRLFISGKTASVHVSSILRKLGATSRTEAAHLASRDHETR